MNYWWVSQNKTYRAEATGGYLWSPKTAADEKFNPNYEFMTEIKPFDIIFSYVGSKIKSVGVAISEAYTSSKPVEFGNQGQDWNEEGWRVDVDYRQVLVEASPKDTWDQIKTLLPSKYAPLNKDGNGVQAYLFKISEALAQHLLIVTGTGELEQPVISLDKIRYREQEQEIVADASLRETQKAQLVQARRGQGAFRNRVKIVERECRVTLVSQDNLLTASHIKPWSDSDNEERLNGNNGLFLSPHVDRLFDKGFITFEKNGELVVSDRVDATVLDKWAIDPGRKYGKFNSDQDFFLAHHREKVFKA